MVDDTFLTTMGRRIAQCRKQRQMTQEQLAEKMGVSLQTVSCIELGKKAIRPENLANLCARLDVSADYVLYGKREERQMNETVEKLSELPPEAYAVIQTLVSMLHEKNNAPDSLKSLIKNTGTDFAQYL